jgi:hypothetical protein
VSVKAKLRIHLLANDVVVAESDDASLWTKILQVIEGGDADAIGDAKKTLKSTPAVPDPFVKSKGVSGNPLGRLAAEIGVGVEALEGACAPSAEAPFIHLDKHCWEALKKHTGERGRGAVNGPVLAATLLVLWSQHSGSSLQVSTAEIPPVLSTIKLPANNIARSINNCEWLRLTGSKISLNPAKTSKAIAVLKAYCSGTAVETTA